METFNLTKVNDVEVKEEFQANISNRFAALENLYYDDDEEEEEEEISGA